MQSTGGPVNTVIMGNWFGPKNRGYIFGSWTCHQYVGNIVAAVIASVVLLCDISWTWALLVPSVSNILWGFTCILFLPENPESVGIELPESPSNPVRKQSDRGCGVSPEFFTVAAMRKRYSRHTMPTTDDTLNFPTPNLDTSASYFGN